MNSKSLTISSAKADGSRATLDGGYDGVSYGAQYGSQLVQMNQASIATFNNINFKNGYKFGSGGDVNGFGGAFFNRGGDLTISNADFVGNFAENGNGYGNGGAIFTHEGAVHISDVLFHDNTVDGGMGGAIYVYDASALTVIRTSFTDNTTPLTGGNGGAAIAAYLTGEFPRILQFLADMQPTSTLLVL